MKNKNSGKPSRRIPEEVVRAQKKLARAIESAEVAYAEAIRRNKFMHTKADQEADDKYNKAKEEAKRMYLEMLKRIGAKGKELNKSFKEISEEIMQARNKYNEIYDSIVKEHSDALRQNIIMHRKADQQAEIDFDNANERAKKEYQETIKKIGWKSQQ